MDSMAKNKYHDIAAKVMGDAQAPNQQMKRSGRGPSDMEFPNERPPAPVDPMALKKEFEQQNPERGGDAWYVDQAHYVLDGLGPDRIAEMGLVDVGEATGMYFDGVDENTIQLYQNLSPETKERTLRALAEDFMAKPGDIIQRFATEENGARETRD